MTIRIFGFDAEHALPIERFAGSGAFSPNGEIHSKGSEIGMLAVMIQLSESYLAVTD